MRQQQRSSSNDGDGLSKDLSSSILHNLLASCGTGSSNSNSIWDNQLIRESMAELLMGEKEDKIDMNKSQQRRKKRNTHNGRSTSCSRTNDSLVKSITTSLMKHMKMKIHNEQYVILSNRPTHSKYYNMQVWQVYP